jgi:hypothetical protein
VFVCLKLNCTEFVRYTFVLLFNVLNEFAQGYVFNDVLVLIDAVFAIAGAVVVLQDEGFVFELVIVGNEVLIASDRESDLQRDILDLEVEVLSIVFNAVAEVILSGFVCEGSNPFVYVVALFVENLSAVICNDLANLCVRGLNFPALFVRGNSFVAVYVGFCELLALALRPVSLAIRLFANLVNGVLIASLLSPICLEQVAGAVSVQVVSVGSVFGLIGLFINVSAVIFFEAIVSVIQIQIYFILIRSYISIIQN